MTDKAKKAVELLEDSIGEYYLEAVLVGFYRATQQALNGQKEMDVHSIKFVFNDEFVYELIKPYRPKA